MTNSNVLVWLTNSFHLKLISFFFFFIFSKSKDIIESVAGDWKLHKNNWEEEMCLWTLDRLCDTQNIENRKKNWKQNKIRIDSVDAHNNWYM